MRTMLIGTALTILATSCTQVASQMPPDTAEADPVVTDGDKYHALLENDRVRVLRYHDEPGEKTHLHHHPEFVLVALAPFRRLLTFPDGSAKEREFVAGDVAFMQAQSHIGENIGSTPTEALLIELKLP